MTTDSELPLGKVMDLLLDAVCVVDIEGRFVYVNAACERLFGYAREELIGRVIFELVFPADRERTRQSAEKVMRGDYQLHFENRYVRKDGEIVHIMWSARWSEADGLRIGVARDITELKRAERMQDALYQIAEAAHVSAGLPALCRHIHRAMDDLLPAANFYLALYDKTSETVSFPYFVDEREQAPEPRALVPGSPLAEVIGTSQPVLVAQSGEQEGEHLQWLGAPLISLTGVVGALVVQSYSRSVAYTEQHKRRLHFVATQAAAAIERKQAESRLLHMASHDPLTDLPNRTLFEDRFNTALKGVRRYGGRLGLLYLDLNEFKQVNDRFGHDAGDRLLREVGQRLVGCLRESDTVGRIGGDEFTVLLTRITRQEDVGVIAEKIRAAIAAPFELDGQVLNVSASIGTAVCPEQGDRLEQLFRQADSDMYASKRRVS